MRQRDKKEKRNNGEMREEGEMMKREGKNNNKKTDAKIKKNQRTQNKIK